jgi:hypothetical protein
VRIDEAPSTLIPFSDFFLIASSKIAKVVATNTEENKRTKTMTKNDSNNNSKIGMPINAKRSSQTRPSPVNPLSIPPLDVPMRNEPNPTLKNILPAIPGLTTVSQITGAEAHTLQLLWDSSTANSPNNARVCRATIAPLDQPANGAESTTLQRNFREHP